MIDYLEIAQKALERWQAGVVPDSGTALAKRPARFGTQEPEDARSEVSLSWVEWKAQNLNRLFQGQGLTGQPGRITAETVRHGERPPRPIKNQNKLNITP